MVPEHFFFLHPESFMPRTDKKVMQSSVFSTCLDAIVSERVKKDLFVSI